MKKNSQARKDWEVEKEQDTGKKWGMKKPAGGQKKKWRPTGSAEEQDGGGSALRAAGAQEAAGCPQISRWGPFAGWSAGSCAGEGGDGRALPAL